MGSATSFLSGNAARQRRQAPAELSVATSIAATAPTSLHGNSIQSRPSVEMSQVQPSPRVEILNHVTSMADGRISSQRLVIDTPSVRTEYRETTVETSTQLNNSSFAFVMRSSPSQSGKHSSDSENDLKVSIPYTPKGEEADQFKYYCPLCFQYYKFMSTTSDCCNNYICFPCIQDFLKTKGVANVNRFEDFRNNVALNSICCPHCQTKGFHPKFCNPADSIRDYSHNSDQLPASYLPSPLKIGETFEDLKRKMIPFKVLSSISSSTSQSIRTTAAAATSSPVVTGIPFDAVAQDRRVAGIAMAGSGDDSVQRLPPFSTFSATNSRGTSQRLSSSNNVPIASLQVMVVDTPREEADDDLLETSYDDHTERLLQGMNQATTTPYADKRDAHARVIADDELSETVDMLEDSYNSRIFPRLAEQMEPTEETKEEEERKAEVGSGSSRIVAVHMVKGFMDLALTRVQLVQ